jgi:putative ABC transport system permease protein
VGAIAVVFAARSRRYWRSWLALAVLVALGTGLVLAAVTAGRRADSAFPRFVAAHGYDAIVYTSRPLPLATLPEVTQAVPITAPFHAAPWCSCGKTIDDGDFAVRQAAPADLTRMVKLVSGRMPDQSNPREAVASFTMQRDYGIGPGTLIRFQLPGPDQRDAIMAAMATDSQPPGPPDGPVVTLTVTGIVAAESEFPVGLGASYDLYPTGAFARATSGTPALPFYYVRLRHGAADLAQFDSTVSGKYQAGVEDLDRPAAAITASVHPQAIGWWVLAGLAALAAIGVAGQALARQTAAESADDPVLAALGLRTRQFVALSMLRTLALSVAGVAGGVALAYALSPLAPAGEARLADPTPGLAFDEPVAAAGAAGALALALVLGLVPALRAARGTGRAQARDVRHRAARPSWLAAALAAAGLPLAAALGIRQALERGKGPRANPVGTALAGTVAAVAALCATAVFGASTSHLISSPDLYGDPFQVYFASGGTGSAGTGAMVPEFRGDPLLDRVTLATVPALTVNHADVRAIAVTAVRGQPLLSIVDGRPPDAASEIALGSSPLRAVGARLGSAVTVGAADPDGITRASRFRVVGVLAFSPDSGTGGLGSGAALTTDAFVAAQCPPSPSQAKCLRDARARPPDAILVRAAPGPAGSAALARHLRQHADGATFPSTPAALVNFGESANFPLLLGIVVALCGAATLLHLLVVSVARRRADSALLRALGFIRRQLAAVVGWQSATVAVAGIVVGVPLGIAVGRAIWRAFATYVGVVPVPVLPGGLIAALAAGVVAAALVIAIVPALLATRPRPAAALRAE